MTNRWLLLGLDRGALGAGGIHLPTLILHRLLQAFEVRAGLHTGECELAGSRVSGIAVHIGARVAAAAT